MSVLDVLVPFTCRDCGFVLRVPVKDYHKMAGDEPETVCPQCTKEAQHG